MGKLLIAYYLENRKHFFKEIISIIIMYTILLTFTIYFGFYQHSSTVAFKETDFDMIIQGFTEEQIDEINSLPFVEASFSARILSGFIPTDYEGYSFDIYAADNFQNTEYSYFNNQIVYKKDEEILENPALNPIIIDKELSKFFKANIGDSIKIPFGEHREVTFTVAGISEPLQNSLGFPVALILWQGEQEQIFKEEFGNSPPYSNLFLKVNDKELANDYFLNKYIPKQFMNENTLTNEEILRYNASLNFNREVRLNQLHEELKYTPPIIILISILGFITLLIVLFREANKKFLMQEKDFSILRALGMPNVNYIFLYLAEMMVIHIPILFFSSLLVKYLIYDFIGSTYLPWYFLFSYCIGAFIAQQFAIFINGFLMHLKTRKSNISYQLAKE